MSQVPPAAALAGPERASRVDVVELTRQLVRIPSVYRPAAQPPTAELEVAATIRDLLLAFGADVNWIEPVKDRPVVVGTIDFGRPGRTLLFEAHTDTVTEGDSSSWDFDPFGAELSDGFIHGRGTIDTKGNLAAALVAARSLIDDVSLSGRIVLCFPCDEEDRMLGIKAFIAGGGADGIDGAIICEPESNRVCLVQKGAMRWWLTVRGRMAHGAMPETGSNPIPRAAAILGELAALDKNWRDTFGEDGLLGWPSVTPTVLQAPATGEPQINVIPSGCYIGVDVRTIPGQDHLLLIAQAQEALARLEAEDAGFQADFEVLEDRPWTSTSSEAPIAVAVAEAVQEVTGSPPVYDGVPGTTDGTFLHLRGIPIVTIGAGDRLLPHQANERVRVDELVEITEIYAAAARRFLGGST